MESRRYGYSFDELSVMVCFSFVVICIQHNQFYHRARGIGTPRTMFFVVSEYVAAGSVECVDIIPFVSVVVEFFKRCVLMYTCECVPCTLKVIMKGT